MDSDSDWDIGERSLYSGRVHYIHLVWKSFESISCPPQVCEIDMLYSIGLATVLWDRQPLISKPPTMGKINISVFKTVPCSISSDAGAKLHWPLDNIGGVVIGNWLHRQLLISVEKCPSPCLRRGEGLLHLGEDPWFLENKG